jgi:hypothetical protein
MQPRLFVSTFPYALIKHARALGVLPQGSGPEAEIALMREHEKLRGESPWPAYRTLAELDRGEPFVFYATGAGSIAQARSRVAGLFWRVAVSCDVWLTLDDDIFAPEDTLARLVGLARKTEGIATVPYLLRDGQTASIAGVTLSGDGAIRAQSSGMGLVAMHRSAVERIARDAPRAVDDKGARYPALFLEYIDEWLGWLGEDIAFSERAAKAGCLWHVLPDAPVCHAGRWSRIDRDGAFSLDPKSAEGLR